MINPIEILRQDVCPKCNHQRGLELYDINDRPLYFSIILDRYETDKSIIDRFDNRILSYFKCKNCYERYMIEWQDPIPYPLADNMKLKKFLENYGGKLNE